MPEVTYTVDTRWGLRRPWEYGHPTQESIKSNRPITGTEAQWLLDEIERLHKLESFVKTMCHELRGARDACDKALTVIPEGIVT